MSSIAPPKLHLTERRRAVLAVLIAAKRPLLPVTVSTNLHRPLGGVKANLAALVEMGLVEAIETVRFNTPIVTYRAIVAEQPQAVAS